jgi:hypothetical protein
VLAKGVRRIEPYRPAALGLDLDHLLSSVGRWSDWLARAEGEPPAAPTLRVTRPAELR